MTVEKAFPVLWYAVSAPIDLHKLEKLALRCDIKTKTRAVLLRTYIGGLDTSKRVLHSGTIVSMIGCIDVTGKAHTCHLRTLLPAPLDLHFP